MTLTMRGMMKSGAEYLPAGSSVVTAVRDAVVGQRASPSWRPSLTVRRSGARSHRGWPMTVRRSGARSHRGRPMTVLLQWSNTAPSQAAGRVLRQARRMGGVARRAPVRRRSIRSVAGVALLAALGGLAGGAALMYWFDPDRGRSRRTRFRSHSQAVVRGAVRRAGTRTSRHAHHLEGRLKGAAMRASGHGRYHPASDVDLREHLRQVIRSLPVPTCDVNVDVCDGRASLRGQVECPEHQKLIRNEVARCPGVEEVDDFLHLPGMPAPNKLAALSLSKHNGQVRA